MQAGTRLGPYEVVALLGAGGMGEVYRARDTRLGREVAVKVLPDEVAKDPRALSRFEHEAKAVAALSHPNILALHDVGKEGAVSFVVMELLDGETLRELLARGPVPLRKALDVASQVADGLAAAHGKGIVHRDVKPENIFLTKEGRAKLLDFGIARQRLPAAAPDTVTPTITAVSEPGVLIGTVAYMSPEQARGAAVDFRSDQFSLGVVLYEMLTGRRPFGGTTPTETLASILRDDPEPLERAAPGTPVSTRLLVERLLTKEPDGRYDSTRDLARDLAMWKLNPSGASGDAVAASVAAGRPGRERWLPWAVALGLAMSLGIVALLAGRRIGQNLRTERFEIVLPEGYRLATRGGGSFLDISPDGKLVVYSAFTWKKPWELPDAPQLFLHSLDRFQSRPIPGTEGGSQPVFSPDGRRIAFVSSIPPRLDDIVQKGKSQDLMVVPVEGGTPTKVREHFEGLGAWAPDGTVLGGPAQGPLMRFPWGDGKPEPMTILDEASSEISHRLPHFVPDGRTVLYTAIRHELDIRPEGGRIYAQRLGEKTRHLLVEQGTDGRFAPPDLLLFGRRGTLMVARLDMSAWKLVAPPEPVLEGVTQAIYGYTRSVSGVVGVAVARDGTLVYAPGSVVPEIMRSLVWLDRQGGRTPLDFPKGEYANVRFSPDGRQALVSTEYPGTQAQLLDLERGSRRNVTFRGDPWAAIWGPGSNRITFDSNEKGARQLYTRSLAGPQEESEKLATGSLAICGAGSWSPDGRLFAFVVHQEGKGNHNIWLLERGSAPRPFQPSPFSELSPEISPDGRYLLYVTNEPGRPEVLVKPLDGSTAPIQVSVGGGSGAIWAHDGSSIYYDHMVEPGVGVILRVAVKRGQGGLAVGRPEEIPGSKVLHYTAAHTFDLAPDGRFLVVQPPTDAERRAWWEHACPNRIRVVLGGVDSLRREATKER